MAWIQIVSYTLALSSVVVGEWCGGLFGIWLELRVLLAACLFLNWIPVVTTHPQLSAPLLHYISVKASQNQAGQTISNDLASLLA